MGAAVAAILATSAALYVWAILGENQEEHNEPRRGKERHDPAPPLALEGCSCLARPPTSSVSAP